MRANSSLDALNFALAGAREGFGPFLGVYLQQRGWDPASIGMAMGLAGLAGILSSTPVGALIDRASAKRSLIVAAVATIALGAVAIVLVESRWLVALAQVAIGVADDAIAPLVAAVTLGLVGQKAYGDRVGRNEAFNHSGNAASAALAGLLGYALGLGWVAISIIVMAAASSAAALRIDPRAIDGRQARGGAEAPDSVWRTIVGSRPLLLLGASAFLLQTANGAMLPFLAQARTAAGADPSLTTATMVVIAQVTMIGAALIATRTAHRTGYGLVLTVALALTAIRGAVAGWTDGWGLIVPVQILEGIAMGFAGVAIPSLIAAAMSGTGRAGAGLGGVMAAFGAGATLSPVLAGFVSERFGYPAAFWTMGSVAALGALLWSLAGSGRAETGQTD